MSRNLTMHSKPKLEQGPPQWQPEATGHPSDPEKTEVIAESPRWRPASVRFRLIGVADMRGSADAVEKPAAPLSEYTEPSPPIERIHES
ncbi:MAG: hypothetical protein KDN05_00415 [Verrucomicrobiae bacterium]|nr:hypothetical protein [Verrucomicrobiae bacterium]